jgi:hypothetical protein
MRGASGPAARTRRPRVHPTGGVNAPDKRGTRTVNSSTTTLDRQRVTVTAVVWSAR